MSELGDIEARRRKLDRVFQDITKRRRRGAVPLEDIEHTYRQLIEDYGHIEQRERQAMVGINLAQALQQFGELDSAAEEYELARRRALDVGDRRRVGLALGGLATIASDRGRIKETEKLLEQALTVFRALDDPVGVGNQLGNLGLLRQNQGRLEEAVGHFTEAAQCFAGAGYVPGAVGVLQAMGELHRRQGEFEDAEAAHRKALEFAENAKLPLPQAHSSRALGQIRRLRGDLDGARRWIERGMRVHRELGDLRGELSALIDLGTVDFAMGHTGSAIRRLDECERRAADAKLVTPRLKALLNRALYRLDTQHVDLVAQDLADAEPLLDTLNDPAANNVWAVTSARVMIRAAQWDGAQTILDAEMARAEANNMAPVRPALLGLMGSIAVLRGDLSAAAEHFDESETLYRALGDVEGARMAVMARIRIQLEAGQLEASLTGLDSLLQTLEKEGSAQPVLMAELLATRSSVYDLSERFEESLADSERAISLFEEIGFQVSLVGARLARLNTLASQHRLADGELSDDYLDQLEALMRDAIALGAPTQQVVAQCSLADAYLLSSHLKAGLELAEEAFERARALSFPDGMARALEVLARAREDKVTAARAVVRWRAVRSTVRAERVMREWNLSEAEVTELTASTANE